LGVLEKSDDDRVLKHFELSETKRPFSKILSENKDKIYFMGIIDTLTEYGMRKKGEFLGKVITQGSGVSCVPAGWYKNRFDDFMKQILLGEYDK